MDLRPYVVFVFLFKKLSVTFDSFMKLMHNIRISIAPKLLWLLMKNGKNIIWEYAFIHRASIPNFPF